VYLFCVWQGCQARATIGFTSGMTADHERSCLSLQILFVSTGGQILWEICRRWPKNRGQKQSSIHLHSKQSRKLARSCFSWIFFAFHSTIYKLTVILLKIDHGFRCFGMIFFVIEWLEEVNMATWTWEQIPYTSSYAYGLFKTVINEEKRDMRMKCKLKFILCLQFSILCFLILLQWSMFKIASSRNLTNFENM
jgi:hypothetical protein